MIVFGPVPSRRLGRSLGINNIPPKHCSYACIYCQLGRTSAMTTARQSFYHPDEILHAVKEKVIALHQSGDSIDYLTLVSDGEPTLDEHLGTLIEMLKALNLKVAVITNSSLITVKSVKNDLRKADWVSVKIDSIEENIWKSIDRPHGSLDLHAILNGLINFSSHFNGFLATETMLIHGINDKKESLEQTADFIRKLSPSVSYLAIPTRPPAEKKAVPPNETALNNAYQIFSSKLKNVEYLIGYEGNTFASTGNIRDDLLSITAVHPMREEAVQALLDKSGEDWDAVEGIIRAGLLIRTEHNNRVYFARKLTDPGNNPALGVRMQ